MTNREARLKRLMDAILIAYLQTNHPFATERTAEISAVYLRKEINMILDEEYEAGADAGSLITLEYLEDEGIFG